MRWGLEVSVVCLLAGLGAGCQVPAEGAGAAARDDAFDEEQQAGAAQNPEGVSFTLRVVSPTGVFHQGERVPVELSFSSRIPARYLVDLATYDRSGRLSSETYHVAPAGGVSDPLQDYFDHGIFMGGGLRSVPVLGDEPQKVVFDVNEWLRFDEPGHYRLWARSARIQSEPDAAPDLAWETCPATSAVVAFEILPADAAWSAAELQRAASALDAPEKPGVDEEREEAARALRFLGTREAAREMVERFRGAQGGGVDFDMMFGLVGSPHREEVVSLLEARLDAPDFPVTATFLDTLVLLRDKLDRPASLGPYPEADPEARRLWMLQSTEAGAAREAVFARYAERLAARAESKSGPARATSVATLLEDGIRRTQRLGDLPGPPWYARVASRVSEVFADLPPEQQRTLLEHRWKRIAAPAMLPALRRLAGEAAVAPELRAVALRRLHEVAPDEARALVLAALRAPGPPLGYDAFSTLAMLPDALLPEVEDALAERFERCARGSGDDDLALVAKLLARYATASVSGRVWTAWTAARPRDDAAPGVLAFLARADPARAADLAREHLERARATHSVHVMDEAARIGMGPAIERALLDALDDGDARLAAGAAATLGRHGSAAALPRLWRRLERWSAAWQGRSGELRRRHIQPGPNEAEVQLEGALCTAIATGSAWVADRAALARLDALLVTRGEKEQLGYLRDAWVNGPVALALRGSDDGTTHARLAHYDLYSLEQIESKLALFPRGTRFACSGAADLPAEVARLEAFVAERGMALDR